MEGIGLSGVRQFGVTLVWGIARSRTAGRPGPQIQQAALRQLHAAVGGYGWGPDVTPVLATRNVRPPKLDEVAPADFATVICRALVIPSSYVAMWTLLQPMPACYAVDAIPIIQSAITGGVFRTGIFGSFTLRHANRQVSLYTGQALEPQMLDLQVFGSWRHSFGCCSKAKAPLSSALSRGACVSWPSSSSRLYAHLASRPPSFAAINSASQVDWAIKVCFLEPQLIRFPHERLRIR